MGGRQARQDGEGGDSGGLREGCRSYQSGSRADRPQGTPGIDIGRAQFVATRGTFEGTISCALSEY